MTLGQYIQKLRLEKELTCEELSQNAGVDLKTLQNLEADAESERDFNTIYFLVKFFDIHASSFLKIDADNIPLSNITKNQLQLILAKAHHPRDYIEDILKSDPFIPWKKDSARLIIAAAKYKIYFKTSKSVSLQSLLAAFDKLFTPLVHSEANSVMYLTTGQSVDGANSFFFDCIELSDNAIPGIKCIHIDYKNKVTIERKIKAPSTSIAAFGGNKSTASPTSTPEERANLDADISEE